MWIYHWCILWGDLMRGSRWGSWKLKLRNIQCKITLHVPQTPTPPGSLNIPRTPTLDPRMDFHCIVFIINTIIICHLKWITVSSIFHGVCVTFGIEDIRLGKRILPSEYYLVCGTKNKQRIVIYTAEHELYSIAYVINY